VRARRRRLNAAVLALITAFALARAAAAQEASAPVSLAQEARAQEGWGYALANELMSPWCPGFALPDCASGYAQDLRLWILEQERLGRSEQDVRAEILAKYGEKMLQAPRAEGRGILAYAIPAALILAGLAVLVRFLRKQGGEPAPPASGSAPAADPSLLSRVDRELASHEDESSAA
jgi:cytochrome c-type biogenesis protein CcmH